MIPAHFGHALFDRARFDVYTVLWDSLIAAVKSQGYGTETITERSLSLGTRDSDTGWRAITYSEASIEALLLTSGASFSYQNVGFYGREDASLFTIEPVTEYSQFKTADEAYYKVKTVKHHRLFSGLAYRECQLTEIPVWQAAPSSLSSVQTRASDPRARMKIWLETYLRPEQTTMSDDETPATCDVIYAEPPYPLEMEYRAEVGPVHGLYVVDQPSSSPLLDALTKGAYGYNEAVPVHTVTVDSSYCSGSALAWKMEAELRYCCETYPTSSRRQLEARRKHNVNLGSTVLYDTEYVISYSRGNTV